MTANQSNTIEHFEQFQSITFPDRWLLAPQKETGRSTSWLKIYSPTEDQQVQIALFHNGRALPDEQSRPLRNLLSALPRTIYDESRSIEDKQLVLDLSIFMGNTGDNQVTNLHTEYDAPVFHLKKLETITVNGKYVVHTQGHFRDENGKMLRLFDGILFDGTPREQICRPHEVIFQAPTEETFSKYFPSFEQTLNSIRWTD